MLIKRKHWAISTGYHAAYDCRYGVSLAFGLRKNWLRVEPGHIQTDPKYKLICGFCFDRPRLVWFNKYWALHEPGYIQGMPVMRAKPKRWRLRGIHWERYWWWHWHK